MNLCTLPTLDSGFSLSGVLLHFILLSSLLEQLALLAKCWLHDLKDVVEVTRGAKKNTSSSCILWTHERLSQRELQLQNSSTQLKRSPKGSSPPVKPKGPRPNSPAPRTKATTEGRD
eukprot:1413797-Amphidinium_carterae.1